MQRTIKSDRRPISGIPNLLFLGYNFAFTLKLMRSVYVFIFGGKVFQICEYLTVKEHWQMLCYILLTYNHQ